MKSWFCFILILISITTFAQNGNFRTIASGDWDDPATWEQDVDMNGIWGEPGDENPSLSSPNNDSGTITIGNGHTVTIDADITIDETTILGGGNLIVATGFALTLNEDFATSPLVVSSGATLTVNGTLDATGLIISVMQVNGTGNVISTGVISAPDDPLVIEFNGTSTYTHDHPTGGAVPNALWALTSTCLITGMDVVGSPAPPTNLDQAFGNFTWNCPGQTANATFNFGGQLTTVNGSLTFVTSANRPIRFARASTGYTLNIGQNFSNQGVPIILTDAVTTATVVNVGGDYSQTGGSLTFRASTPSTVALEVRGDFNKTTGAFAGGTGTGSSSLVFDGATSIDDPQLVDIAGTAPATLNYIIRDNSHIQLGSTSSLTGAGTLTVASGSSIAVTSNAAAGALQLGNTAGSILTTGVRTYESGATIVYAGSAVAIGTGHPTDAGISTLIRSNVALVANTTITGDLILNGGNLSVSSFTLTLAGAFTRNSNSLVFNGSPTYSSLVINGSGAFGTLSTSAVTLNNFTVNRSSGSVTLGNNLTTVGTFTQTNGNLILNGNTLRISGAFARTGGFIQGSNTSSVIIDGTGAVPVGGMGIAGGALNTLTLDRAGVTLLSSSAFTVTNLNLLEGSLNNTGTITMASGGAVITRDIGSLSNAVSAASSYDVLYQNSGVDPQSTGPELPTTATGLRHLTIDATGGNILLSAPVTVNGTLTFTNGIFNSNAQALVINGNVVSNNTSTLTASAITFSGTTVMTGGTQIILGPTTITGTVTPNVSNAYAGSLDVSGTLNAGSGSTTFQGANTITLSGSGSASFNNFIISSSGSVTAPTGTINVSGNFTMNGGGAFAHNNGTVNFNGSNSSVNGTGIVFGSILISGTLNGPTNLSLVGNFTDNGTFNRGTGTVNFTGTDTQIIGGSAVTNFNNINITNTAGPPSVQITTNKNLRGVLTLAAGTNFDPDGVSGATVFTLVSTGDSPTSDAAIAQLPATAVIDGAITVQRYMSIEGANSGRIYRFISSPIANAPVTQLLDNIPISGTFTGANHTGNQSMFAYDERSINTDVNGDGVINLHDGYFDFPNTTATETMENGRGYSIFIRANESPISGAGSARWDIRGAVNRDEVIFNSFTFYTPSSNSASDGWNLVGNPYPSTIDWDAATGWTRTGLDNALYMRDNGRLTPAYATYINGSSVNGGSRYIPIGQAFQVRTNNASVNFRATEAVKVAGTQSTFFREEKYEALRITLLQGADRDETLIRFTDKATNNFDSQWDAYKFRNDQLNVFTKVAGTLDELAINVVSLRDCGEAFEISVEDVKEGTYDLGFSELETLPADLKVYLFDAFTGTTVNVREKNYYTFEVTKDSVSFGSKRFEIRFTTRAIPVIEASLVKDCVSENIQVVLQNSEPDTKYRLSRNGHALTEWAPGGENLQLQVSTATLNEGDNVITVQAAPGSCRRSFADLPLKVFKLSPVKVTFDSLTNTLASSYAEGNQWFMNGEKIDGATGQVLQATVPGVYEVRVTSPNACVISGSFDLLTLDVENDFTGVSVYPNPVSNELNIEVADKGGEPTVDMIGTTGKRISAIALQKTHQGWSGTVNMTDYPAGLYMIKISQGKKFSTHKVLKK